MLPSLAKYLSLRFKPRHKAEKANNMTLTKTANCIIDSFVKLVLFLFVATFVVMSIPAHAGGSTQVYPEVAKTMKDFRSSAFQACKERIGAQEFHSLTPLGKDIRCIEKLHGTGIGTGVFVGYKPVRTAHGFETEWGYYLRIYNWPVLVSTYTRFDKKGYRMAPPVTKVTLWNHTGTAFGFANPKKQKWRFTKTGKAGIRESGAFERYSLPNSAKTALEAALNQFFMDAEAIR